MASEPNLIAATTTCFLGLDPWVAFECLRSAGVRYVEVPALPARQSIEWGQTTFSPETLGPTGTQRLRERLAEMDLVPITVGAYASVLEPDDLQPLLSRIEFAQHLGAAFVIIDAAGREPDGASEWRRLGNLGRFLGDYAEARGVRLAFEIHAGLARSGAIARRLLDAIDHAAVGVNYDTGNAIFYNDGVDPVADLQLIADRVIHVHLKDTSGGRGDWAFGALGTGHVELPAIVRLLQGRGFRGPYSLEVEGYAGEDLTRDSRIERVRQSLQYLASLGSLKEKAVTVATPHLSVVSVGAHQDDELGCLGTLIRYRDAGCRITTVSLSNGDKGGQHDPSVPHSAVAATRIDEATRMAAELGGEYFCLGLEDGFVFDSREIRLALAEILRTAEADVVLTLPSSDYNNDHIMAGQIALHASLIAAINVIETRPPPLVRAPAVLFMDTIVGLDFQPTHYVDISDQFTEKTRLLRLHDSQMRSQPNITGWDLVTHAEVVGRFRGQQCGVRYAEGFRPALRTPLLRPGWVLPD